MIHMMNMIFAPWISVIRIIRRIQVQDSLNGNLWDLRDEHDFRYSRHHGHQNHQTNHSSKIRPLLHKPMFSILLLRLNCLNP